MRFAVAAKGGADALLQFRGGQQPCRLGDPLLPSQPLGLDRIEPGALGGQVAGEQTDTLPRLLDLAVVLPHPLAHDLAIMPGGVVPDRGLDPAHKVRADDRAGSQ